MDFISKLINRPRSVILSCDSEMDVKEDKSIEELLVEINENLNQSIGSSPAPKQSPKLGGGPSNKKPLPINFNLNDSHTLADENLSNDFQVKNTPDNFGKAELSSTLSQSPTSLPDIVNVQPGIEFSKPSPDDSLISHLTKSLNSALILNSPRVIRGNSTLPLPTSTCGEDVSGVSSDDELFTECQSYPLISLNATANVNEAEIYGGVGISNDIKLNATVSQWDNLVTSVITSSTENLDNTIEQIDNIDALTNEYGAADSTTSNTNSANTTAEVAKLQMDGSDLVSSGNFESNADTEEILQECNKAIEYEPDNSVGKNNIQNYSPSEMLNVTTDLVESSSNNSEAGLENISSNTSLNKNFASNSSEIELENVSINEAPCKNITCELTSEFSSNFPLKYSPSANAFPTSPGKIISDSPKSPNTSKISINPLNLVVGNISMHSDEPEVDTPKVFPNTPPKTDYTTEFPFDQSSPGHSQPIESSLNTTDKFEIKTLEKLAENTDINVVTVQTFEDDFEIDTSTELGSNLQDPISAAESLVSNSKFRQSPQNATDNLETKTPHKLQLHKVLNVANSQSNLNSTFAASSEALNSTVNLDMNRTFGSSQDIKMNFNQTLNESINLATTLHITDVTDKCFAQNACQPSESMDIDVDFPRTNKVRTENPFDDSVNPFDILCTSTKAEKEFKNIGKAEVEFKVPNIIPSRRSLDDIKEPTDEDFQSNGLILNPADFDFDFLLTKGSAEIEGGDRSSLLLRFDPLLGLAVPSYSQLQSNSQAIINPFVNTLTTAIPNQLNRLSSCQEESSEDKEDLSLNEKSQSNVLCCSSSIKQEPNSPISSPEKEDQQFVAPRSPIQITTRSIKKNDKMSVDVIQDLNIENDVKSIDNLETETDEKLKFKMDELENKIKNEVLKTEDIEKKLKDAEQREEALLKRITEKDKKMAKINDVIEAYEKAIAELIAEKEQIIQNYEQQLNEVKEDRDSNYRHLTSLETTFSDLHVKYEKSKELTAQLKSSEEGLQAEKKQNLENLRLQEQRYEKMKNHAMQQLEIANKKLESLTKNHTTETTKLKALLKKEEISRASINEQLQQKSRENEELVKICDELINGQGS